MRILVIIIELLLVSHAIAQSNQLIFKLEGTINEMHEDKPLINCPVKLIDTEAHDTILTYTNDVGFFEFETFENGERIVLSERDYVIEVSDMSYKNEDGCGYFSARGVESTKGMKESTRFVKDFELISYNCCYELPLPVLFWGNDVSILVNPTHNGMDSLDFIVKTLEENPTLILEISSHCFVESTPEKNLLCGEQRASSVMEYLTDKGVNPKRMVPRSYGDTKPIYNNSQLKEMNEDDRMRAIYRNNRVVFSELAYDFIAD